LRLTAAAKDTDADAEG
jgi:large subunit ribosomal protein L12e